MFEQIKSMSPGGRLAVSIYFGALVAVCCVTVLSVGGLFAYDVFRTLESERIQREHERAIMRVIDNGKR